MNHKLGFELEQDGFELVDATKHYVSSQIAYPTFGLCDSCEKSMNCVSICFRVLVPLLPLIIEIMLFVAM